MQAHLKRHIPLHGVQDYPLKELAGGTQIIQTSNEEVLLANWGFNINMSGLTRSFVHIFRCQKLVTKL